MKVSKKAGIALFVTTAVIMAVLIVFHKNLGPAADPGQELAKKIISCVVIAAACFAFIHWYDKFTGLPVELFQNRHLIWKLAKNDFKKRYAGSYLGAVWAMAPEFLPVWSVLRFLTSFLFPLKTSISVFITSFYSPNKEDCAKWKKGPEFEKFFKILILLYFYS